jgi:hypothetical protein
MNAALGESKQDASNLLKRSNFGEISPKKSVFSRAGEESPSLQPGGSRFLDSSSSCIKIRDMGPGIGADFFCFVKIIFIGMFYI